MRRTVSRSVGLAFSIVLASACAQTAPQHLAFAGLRTASNQGQFNAIQADASGNLYLLLDQHDGVRLLKTDPTATNVLAEAHLGAQGDVGLALALDPAGNPYVAGTTTSTTLAGTQNAAFPTRADASTNSFLARFDPGLNTTFVTFAGSGRLAATGLAVTADAAFLTGSLFASTLPATPSAYQPIPAQGSTESGFVERFSSDGTTLVYATYLSGANGNTAPGAIAADSSDDAYIAGYTTSAAFPTAAALIPTSTTASGFLTRLTPTGDALTFSTYIPGNGIASIVLDPATQTLLLTGAISLSQFPIATVQTPLVNTPYQSLLRISLDGSTITASTLLAPGTQSVVVPGPNSTAWTTGTLTSPLLPIPPLSTTGTAFVAHITAQATIDQTARFGGLPATNPNNSSAPVTLTSLALDSIGQPYLAGSFTPTTSSDLLATEQYNLSLTDPQPPLLPSSVADTGQAPGTCQGSLCTGSAAYLAQLAATAAPTLALSTGASPNITLRNLGCLAAANLHFTTTGYTFDTNCPGSLPPGTECALSLTGPGPGVLTAIADNAPTQTVFPGVVPTPTPIVFSPHELDFGVQTASSAPILRTLTITNLSSTPQTFTSILDSTSTTSPFSESFSDCPSPVLLIDKVLAPDATCHITFALALNSSTPDGPVTANWTVAASGHHDVLFTAFAQSAALTPSSTTIDFGTRYPLTPHTSRYLYLSNNSDTAISHTPATTSTPFTLTDLCPATLPPHSVCQIQLDYTPPNTPSNDAATLTLDQNISVLVTGQTLPQPTSGSNPTTSLTASPTTLTFSTAIAITATSAPQPITLTNTGTTPYPITIGVTGDFTDTTTCPASLPAQATCTVNLTFAPTAPGTRGGLLTIASTSGAAPIYVGLTGTATPILQTTNGAIPFGTLPITESSVQWLKITHAFQTLTATTASPYQTILVEDTGYGHGSPAPSAFSSTATSTCFNCYLGLRFSPTTTGPQPGTLTLWSTGSPSLVPLTGTATPLTGLIATPATQDFGTIPVNSTSPPTLIALTNLTADSVTLSPPTIAPGFSISPTPTGGPACTGTLAPSSTCFTNIAFSPTATGATTGTLTFQSPTATTAVSLTGTGSPDPGLSLNPTALTFQNVPGPTATRQLLTLTNTSANALTIGVPTTSTANFTATTTCATLAPTATCTVTVTYIPSNAEATAALQIPAGSSTYTIPLTGAYTSQNAGLQLLPAQIDFGPAPTGALAGTRTITLNNLTSKTVSVALTVPAQFAVTDANPCATLTPNASCTFNVDSIPLTTGDPTGTLFATATPTDGSSPSTTLAYLQSYGQAPDDSILAVTSPISSGTGLIDFGQLNSGQTATTTLTLTNQSTTQPISIRRITSQPPFLSTTTCGPPLGPTQTCNITLTYAPINQIPTGSPVGPPSQDIGSLIIESDAVSSPNLIPLTGRASPISFGNLSQTPVLSSYTLTQGSLTFFTTAVGEISPPQTVTLTNTGNTTLHLGTLTTTPEFPVTTTCSQPIAPAATCTISLTFIPQANGPRTAALEVATDSGISLDVLTLYGIASAPSLLLAPLSVDFGTILVGTPSTQTVTVTNNGLVPVTFTAITLTGDYAQTSDCPAPNATLPTNSTCTIQVTFTPTAAGPRPGVLSVSTSASTLPLTVTLTGTGTLTQPQIEINPTTLDFGSIQVGASSTKSVTVTNTGEIPITFAAITLTGDYTRITTCPAPNGTLSPGASCAVEIAFTPAATGTRPGTLTVATSASTSPITVTLTGIGADAGTQPRLQITPTALDFGSIQVGTPSTQSVTITNPGIVPVTFYTANLTGDYTQTNNCPSPNTTLPAGDTCTFQLTFTPTTTGPRPGTLSISTSTASPLTVSLTGIGTTTTAPPQPQIQVTPTTLQFGFIQVGSSSTQTLTVTNTGQVSVTFLNIAPGGDYTQTNSCSSLAPAATCTIQVTFTPTATAARLGVVVLFTSAPIVSIPLSGTGIQPQLQISPSSLNFGSVPIGSSANLPVTLANNATVPISLTLATTGDYSSSPCPATLAPAQVCTPTITFTPTASGTRPGTLVVNGTTIPLTGTGTNATPGTPSFTLTIENSQSAIATVTQGATATYALTATPINGFTGPVTLACAPAAPTPNVTCAIAPTSLTLAGAPQTAALTLTTLTNLNAAYLLPLLLLFRKKTRPRPRAIFATLALLLLSSCGGGPEPNLRYAVPGSYLFTVTATSTTGTPITQTVTASLIITAQTRP
ncbi:choice-of-anchor D domain-containing protein [Granulicella sibirica]|nr:choice-of-anchor D domain-containing protein [Granulicella sibirica]